MSSHCTSSLKFSSIQGHSQRVRVAGRLECFQIKQKQREEILIMQDYPLEVTITSTHDL